VDKKLLGLNGSEVRVMDEGAGDQALSRRRFLAGSAALVGGGAVLAAFPGVAKAHNTGAPSDVDMLNFALTLEHLEANFYIDGLKKFGDNLGRIMRSRFQRIRDHEVEHVDTLSKVIRSVGGRPVPRGTYNFARTAFTSVKKFKSVAQILENTGVSAYDGAIAHIETAELLTGGAQIATIEARHAAYLNLLNGDGPFPDAFDTPVAPRTVFDAAADFITRLPEPYGPYRSGAAFRALLPTRVIGGIPKGGL
jgi:rubrerythrin